MARKITDQQDGILKLASNTKWNLFITLTFTSTRTQEQVTKALKVFFLAIDRTCFGRQDGYKHVKTFPIIEHTAEATHVHIVMVKPEHYKYAKFRDVLIKKWQKIKGAGQANLQKSDSEKSWYEQIVDTAPDRKQVISYMSKQVSKDYSSVDFENIRI